MKKNRQAVLSILLATILMLAACGNNPMPDTKTHYLGTMVAIEYPVDWYVDGFYDDNYYNNGGALFYFLASPQPGDLMDTTEMRPMFALVPASRYGIDSITEEALQTSDLSGDDWKKIEVGGKPAFRESYIWQDGTLQGWFVLAGSDDEPIVIHASAPTDAWEDYKDIFEAMLSTVRFEQ
jgi:hypothetical protein